MVRVGSPQTEESSPMRIMASLLLDLLLWEKVYGGGVTRIVPIYPDAPFVPGPARDARCDWNGLA